MILAVSLNAALDIAYVLDEFHEGAINRPSEIRKYPGGKGVNVARVYTRLGGEAVVTGFIGGRTGEDLLDGLNSEGIANDFVPISENTRLAIGITNRSKGVHTDLNEKGPEISRDEQDAFLCKYTELVKDKSFVVMAGTLPPTVADDFYSELVRISREAGIPCLLDTNGRGLDFGVTAKPSILKMNLSEFSELIGRELTMGEALSRARELSTGEEKVIITLGAAGAFLVSNANAFLAIPPVVDAVSSLGCGDSFSAAFVYALNSGRDEVEAMIFASAAGAANATVVGSGFIDECMVNALVDQIVIQEL